MGASVSHAKGVHGRVCGRCFFVSAAIGIGIGLLLGYALGACTIGKKALKPPVPVRAIYPNRWAIYLGN
jgi:hypothetical protein